MKIQIICPSCANKGFIEISPERMNKSLRGIIAVQIAKNIICSHDFVVYIDNNFNVRDYFTTDFQIELPQITPAEIFKTTKIPEKEIVDLDLIRLNLSPTLLTYIIKSIFFKQKIVIIEDQDFLHKHIYNFFKFITQNSFKTNIVIITKEIYNNNKKAYKDAMIFEDINIIKNEKALINPKKMYVEKQIINRFISENDLGYSYILLKNEILKAYGLSKKIVDFINISKEKNEKINSLKIGKQLEASYGITINIHYLSFLIEIVKYYFALTVPTVRESYLSSI